MLTSANVLFPNVHPPNFSVVFFAFSNAFQVEPMLLDKARPGAKCRPPDAQSHNLVCTPPYYMKAASLSLDSPKAEAEGQGILV